MHAFNSMGVIHKYDSLHAILREFASVRMEMYEKRRLYLLKEMQSKLPYHENVVRFIDQQCEDDPKPDLRRKTSDQCNQLLLDEKFADIGGFNYLLDLPIRSITKTISEKHRNELLKLRESISILQSKTSKDLWLHDLTEFTKIYFK